MSPRRARAIHPRPGVDHATALREHLVEVAHRLIGSSSISAITTRHLAHSAGVSEGVLYNYFGDKRDLIIAGLTRRFEELSRRFEAKLPAAGEGTIESNLTALAFAAQEMQADLIPIFVGLLNEPDLLRRFIEETHREPIMPRANIATYLREEQALGRLSAGVDPGAASTLLMGAMFMTALGRHLMPEGTPGMPAARVEAIVATLIHRFEPVPDDGAGL
jgi:AcrR family transcriptional regulator